jgi:hypothetical protein
MRFPRAAPACTRPPAPRRAHQCGTPASHNAFACAFASCACASNPVRAPLRTSLLRTPRLHKPPTPLPPPLSTPSLPRLCAHTPAPAHSPHVPLARSPHTRLAPLRAHCGAHCGARILPACRAHCALAPAFKPVFAPASQPPHKRAREINTAARRTSGRICGPIGLIAAIYRIGKPCLFRIDFPRKQVPTRVNGRDARSVPSLPTKLSWKFRAPATARPDLHHPGRRTRTCP